MIGAHGHTPGIIYQQIPLKPDGPLQCMNQALFFVFDRNDAASAFTLGIAIEPLSARDFMEEVTEWTITCHGSRFTEHDLAHIASYVRMPINPVRQSGNLGTECSLVICTATIAVEL